MIHMICLLKKSKKTYRMVHCCKVLPQQSHLRIRVLANRSLAHQNRVHNNSFWFGVECLKLCFQICFNFENWSSENEVSKNGFYLRRMMHCMSRMATSLTIYILVLLVCTLLCIVPLGHTLECYSHMVVVHIPLYNGLIDHIREHCNHMVEVHKVSNP